MPNEATSNQKPTDQPGVLLQPFPLLQWPAQGIRYIFEPLFTNNLIRWHLTTITATSICPTTTRQSTPGAKKTLTGHKSEIKPLQECYICVTKEKSNHCKSEIKLLQDTEWLLSLHRTNFELKRICRSRAITETPAALHCLPPLLLLPAC